MLYQRVKKLAKAMCGTDKSLGESIGLKQATFSGYLNESRQHNLWPLLPRMLSLFPQVSREWLYFGEGDIFRSSTPDKFTSQSPEITNLRLIVCDLQNIIQLLNARIVQIEKAHLT